MADFKPVHPRVEIRFFVERDVYDVFDASSKAHRIPKNKLGESIFSEWAAAKRHEATLVLRLSRGNGNDPQPEWEDTST